MTFNISKVCALQVQTEFILFYFFHHCQSNKLTLKSWDMTKLHVQMPLNFS